MRRSFLQFPRKVRSFKAKTYTHCCSKRDPLCASLHSRAVMKSSVGLAVLARVIPYCVHGGVAGQHRGKCVQKGRTSS